MIFDDRLERIEQKAQEIEQAFEQFHELQIEQDLDPAAMAAHKRRLQQMLGILRVELDGYLASEYGIDYNSIPKREEYDAKFAQWQQRHLPFHWWVEFYGIMKKGGFDVIIGNPPYVEYSKVRKEYTVRDFGCIESGNLYAFVIARSLHLQQRHCRIGMIIQLSAFCTPRMISFQDLWFAHVNYSHLSFFDDRPGKLFDGLEHIRVVIAIGQLAVGNPTVATTRYVKFATSERSLLFNALSYQINESPRHGSSVLKVSSREENSLVRKLWNQLSTLSDCLQDQENQNYVYYGYGYGYWGKILNFKSYFRGSGITASTGDKYIYCHEGIDRDVIVAIMNSSLFYWFYTNYSDGHNFTKHVIGSLPFQYPTEQIATELKVLCTRLMYDLKQNARRKSAFYKATGQVEYDEFVPKSSKPIIDEIDRVLAEHYGFTDEELDFIINYDIKYRMGQVSADEEEE